MTTPQVSSAATGRGDSRKSAPVADRHAEVIDGQIHMWTDGRYGPVSYNTAWGEWLWLQDSPIPSSQERARQIRAALDQVSQ